MGQLARQAYYVIGTATMLLLGTTFLDAAEPRGGETDLARRILESTDVQGGLVVHVGCGRGKLTAALDIAPQYIIHGLDTDEANVAAARRHIRSLGEYGRVSVARFDGVALPYADNMVNLIVAENLGQVSEAEVLRVLAPGGVAHVGKGTDATKTIKPWPEAIDEWTHFLHSASNNAVAQDTQVGPPRRLQWVCGPLWTRSHEFLSSFCAMVSAKGRIFYIFDEGQTGITSKSIPEKWTLIARDGFNGALLWKRPMNNWGVSAWRGPALRNIPESVPRRIVAMGDRLFVTLGYDEPVLILDAATGETLRTCKGTEGANEIYCADGVALFRLADGSIVAFDGQTGKELWKVAGKVRPVTLAIDGGRVFYQTGPALMCLALADGKPLWQIPCPSLVALLVVHADRAFVLLGRKLQAVSTETGKTLWDLDGGVSRRELFVANDRLWHWQGDLLVGRDLTTGEVAERPNTDDIFTRGHHFRCYQSKATERYLVAPNRGVEFVDLTGGPHTQSDWVRGTCRYGIVPCNGLLYAPPNPCFCYPGVKITGFNALAPAGEEPRMKESERLEKGPAFGLKTSSESTSAATDWPTYRHDARRSGATAGEVHSEVATQWKVQLPGRLTPPVVADDRVYVAAKDEHTLYAFGAKDGSRLWNFTAEGRIDSPPTIDGGLVLFGSADGCVTCLRATDGQLVWRYTAARSRRKILAFGQLESPWRVHGSILVVDGVAYGTAGRSTYLDGGIRVFALDPSTGRLLHETNLDTWARTRTDAENKPFIAGYHIEGALSDILVSEGDHLFLGQYKLDQKLVEQEVPYVMPGPDDKTVAMDLSNEPYTAPNAEKNADYETHQRKWLERVQPKLLAELNAAYGGYSLGERKMGRHILSTGGFLDDSGFNRTYWTYWDSWPGFYLANRAPKTGQLLVVGDERTYAVQGFPSRNLQSPLFTPGTTGDLLLADANDNEPVLDHQTRGTTKGSGYLRKAPPAWHDWIPVRIRGMVLAGDHLFVAGPPDIVDPKDPMAALEGRKGGLLMAISATDGKRLARTELTSPPVFDGLIAADGRLYISLSDGTLQCLGR